MGLFELFYHTFSLGLIGLLPTLMYAFWDCQLTAGFPFTQSSQSSQFGSLRPWRSWTKLQSTRSADTWWKLWGFTRLLRGFRTISR